MGLLFIFGWRIGSGTLVQLTATGKIMPNGYRIGSWEISAVRSRTPRLVVDR